ncbi:hypothetical protein A2533_01565 [Candidatus Falkowbacteria bacterium RIFOXYD2_FULL_35_9]|uniref:tetrahydrofolate synthase n=1 Tax=Candidatus Falkowbacteria bacterium RIFOXYC2_FULL_36_12 TaxID=1798002 RepID=A0A1F5SZG9_9BACT|nr:MAG: hypothetical protein A2300_00225 [Candidatus Falkowbacteria bacterium RIFOXYB2_FULL_35_7]OGF31886.1 MAG: hypothetical protein A2478_05390 [Candidatus Falkowbacteria bacterium RIFOXYC2_FULL_36_12]OGF33992.1 MAG: hypothetical protein A2223_01780 [Candidatus Falkowbacteria bacterium RIFOXYA2_FULL_35_8]OGF47516.1 MAG: hypothetical protein A2533_01565 [Candidatus Falkowbacteria bacterium RIFOXYD2_FULL_35_9]
MNTILFKKYKQAEQFIESIQNLTPENFFTGKVDQDFLFKRAKYLLALAGNPDKAYKIIHIAGTSGKGSTVNYISKILQKAGYKVGTHYSPFVSVATEKIQINQIFISMKEFVDLVEEMKPIINKCYEKIGIPSYFEVWMIMTLLYFNKKKVDYVILETGCGGRYDASNAVSKTALSIITNIGLDHTFILGDTIEKIAWQKAGIIRSRGKVLTGAEQQSVLNIFKKICKEKNAKLEIIRSEDMNKALALRVGEILKIDDLIIQKALAEETSVPARFEIVQNNPLIIFDGAHNPDKIKYLSEKLKTLKTKSKIGKTYLICALADKKNPKDVFQAIKPLADNIYITKFSNPFRKSCDLLELKQAFKGKATTIFLDPQDALKQARKLAKTNDLILITGSFFLCSDLRKNWISEEKQLEQKTNFPK